MSKQSAVEGFDEGGEAFQPMDSCFGIGRSGIGTSISTEILCGGASFGNVRNIDQPSPSPSGEMHRRSLGRSPIAKVGPLSQRLGFALAAP